MIPKDSLKIGIENQPFSEEILHSEHEIHNKIDILENDNATEEFIDDRYMNFKNICRIFVVKITCFGQNGYFFRNFEKLFGR